MANYELKYTVAYGNISGDNFLLEIFQKSDFTFDENQIAGSVIYTKGSVDDIFEPIRPTTLTINLEASQTNLLEDFQSFNEFDFKVKFYRNSLQIFEGWINPDGWFQDWVNDNWEISMTAVDGLGTLKNLEFSDFEKGQKGTFPIICNWSESNTVLTIEKTGDQSWVDLGLLVGSNFKILSPINRNVGEYNVTSISGSIAVFSVVEEPTSFYNGLFNGNIVWNIFNYAPREINYLHAALKRLGYELPYTIGDDINVDLGVQIDWADITKRIIDKNVFVNDNGTWEDCETVLTDILQKYNLTITQENIEGRLVWYVSRVIYATYPNTAKKNRQYNSVLDASEGSDSVQVLLEQFAFADGHPELKTIYSEINTNIPNQQIKFDAIHCNENQQITFNPALQNFRFESKWKGVRNFFRDILSTWTAVPPYPQNFDIITKDYLQLQALQSVPNDPVFESFFVKKISETSEIKVEFDWSIDYSHIFPNAGFETDFRFVISAVVDSGTFFWNQHSQDWQESSIFSEFTIPRPVEPGVIVQSGKTTFSLRAIPDFANVDYRVTIYKPKIQPIGAVNYFLVRVHSVRFSFIADQLGTGKIHDSTQPEVKSTFLNNPVDVINTNEQNAYFQNNLYRLASPPEIVTGLVPMNNWKATNTTNYSDLLELTGRERIKAKAKPQRLFRGDIFGFIPYSSVIRYDGIGGNFVPLSYQYRTVENIIELECSQIFNEDVEINHEKKYIFENERNVLIKEL